MKLKQKLAISLIRARLNLLTLVSPQKAAKKAFALSCTPTRRSGRRQTTLMKKGEKLSFILEKHKIRGHRWLPGQASPPLKKLLIVHGFESSSGNFGQYIEAFLKKGYEVLAFDAPGHGLSGGKRLTIPLYVHMLRDIYQRYGPIESFMGHSFGGQALAIFLESIPHDLHTRLVLVAPACETVTAVDAFFHLLGLSPELRKEYDKYVLERFAMPLSWYSMRRAMHQVKAATLWLQDEDDRITPVQDTLRVQADGHPNIQFVLTRGLGHRKIYRDEAVAGQITDFL